MCRVILPYVVMLRIRITPTISNLKLSISEMKCFDKLKFHGGTFTVISNNTFKWLCDKPDFLICIGFVYFVCDLFTETFFVYFATIARFGP